MSRIDFAKKYSCPCAIQMTASYRVFLSECNILIVLVSAVGNMRIYLKTVSTLKN